MAVPCQQMGLEGFLYALAQEVASFCVGVTTVGPGAVRTVSHTGCRRRLSALHLVRMHARGDEAA